MARIKKSIVSRNSEDSSILITGGCGFIGANLVTYLLRKGFRNIRILDNVSAGTKENLLDALQGNGDIISRIDGDKITYRVKTTFNENVNNTIAIDFIIGDIRSYETCLNATQNIDVVVHLAAHTGVIPSIEDPFYDWEVNGKGTLNLLYASVKREVDTFIFASSNATLGSQGPPVDERRPPKPLSPYGSSKLAGEGYCSAFYGSYGLKTVNLRFSNVYGPYSLHKQGVVAQFIKDGILKKTLTIFGDGNQSRDFIHVDDLCLAIYLILSTPASKGSIWGETFQIGTGREISIAQLARLVQGFFDERIEISFAPKRKGEIVRNRSDIGKAKMAIGFSPRISLEDGARSVYEWFTSKDFRALEKAEVLSGGD